MIIVVVVVIVKNLIKKNECNHIDERIHVIDNNTGIFEAILQKTLEAVSEENKGAVGIHVLGMVLSLEGLKNCGRWVEQDKQQNPSTKEEIKFCRCIKPSYVSRNAHVLAKCADSHINLQPVHHRVHEVDVRQAHRSKESESLE